MLLNNSPGEVKAQKVPWVSLAEESLARHFAELKVSLAVYTTALICKYKSDLGKQCKNRAMVFEGQPRAPRNNLVLLENDNMMIN